MGLSYSIAFQIRGQIEIDSPIREVWQEEWKPNQMVSQERPLTHAVESDDSRLSLHWFAHRHYIQGLDLVVHPEDFPHFFIAKRADFHCG
jgi:hypothetical protein